MIKLIIFDLDGVLISTKDTHYIALNHALSEVGDQYIINKEDHIKKFDGKPTRVKLEMLTQERSLPAELHDHIYKRKQRFTFEALKKDLKEDKSLIKLFKELSDEYIIYIASNSIRLTVDMILKGLGIYKYIDGTMSNEDVKHPKPHPEMYLRCMVAAEVGAKETLVIEDSYVGRKGAFKSGACLHPVNKPSDLTLEGIMGAIKKNGTTKQKWIDDKLNILIPAAGAGTRFENAGYVFPKPLIDVNGKPMLQTVIENLNIEANFIFVVQEKHVIDYNIDKMLRVIVPDCKIVTIKEITQGAACTTLLAKEFIDNDNELLLANSDQFIEWDSSQFMYAMQSETVDGGILTFENTHPKWSYAKIDEDGWVVKVAEKQPISKHATVGIYFWKKGSDYVKYAERMIEKDIRVNGEFYVCPVYNQAIEDNKHIKIWEVDEMYGLGTPEDLERFLSCKK